MSPRYNSLSLSNKSIPEQSCQIRMLLKARRDRIVNKTVKHCHLRALDAWSLMRPRTWTEARWTQPNKLRPKVP